MRLQTLTYRRWLYKSFWTVLSLFIAGLFYKEVQSSAWRSNSIRPAKTAVSPLIVAPRRWGRFARRNGCFRRLQFPVLLPILLGYVCTLPDSFRAGTKIIPDGATIHTQERLWRRDYCDWAKLCAAAISKVERHISDRCSHYTGQLLMLSVDLLTSRAFERVARLWARSAIVRARSASERKPGPTTPDQKTKRTTLRKSMLSVAVTSLVGA